jgi:quinol monooxygenase YgiN
VVWQPWNCPLKIAGGYNVFALPAIATTLELSRALAYLSLMLIVHVQIRVKPECLDAFKAATLLNAGASVQEPGILRFDVVQQADDPARFVLVEIYRDVADQLAHRETKHYLAWRDGVADLMAEPRLGVKFNPIFPDERAWQHEF